MVGWWGDWKTLGSLPWPGDMGEQPAYVVQALTTCEVTKMAMEREASEKATAKIQEAQPEAR